MKKLKNRRAGLPFLVAMLIAIGVLLASVGCKPHGKTTAMQAPPPAKGTVAPAEQKMIVDWEEFTGRTAPVEYVEVRPRVSGYIQEVRFKAGQLVKKGDVLFVIDPRWAKADIARREAEYAEAKVRFENAKRE